MPEMQVPLILGSYESRSLISEAQRCVNLYSERNPPDSPFPFTLYPTPGLSFIVTAPVTGSVRAVYTASNGACFVVVSNNVYLLTQSYGFVLLGQINSYTGFVSLKDNTLVCAIV